MKHIWILAPEWTFLYSVSSLWTLSLEGAVTWPSTWAQYGVPRVTCWQSLSVTFLFWIKLNAAPLFKECCLLGDFTINRNKYFQQKWREIILPLNHGEFYSCFIWLFKRKSVISMRLVCNNMEPRFFLKGSPEQ